MRVAFLTCVPRAPRPAGTDRGRREPCGQHGRGHATEILEQQGRPPVRAHLKDSAKERGRSTERAEEIAARTVKKQRREEGRTKSGQKSTSGAGNPNRSFEDRSKQELYNRAKQLDIEGRSSMSKQQLVWAIRKHG